MGFRNTLKNPCEIRVVGGRHLLFHNGVELPYQIKTVVTDNLDDIPTVILEILVNLAETK